MTPDTPEFRIILERLHALELQNRRLKRAGITIFAALSGIFLMGQAAPSSRIVEAQKFVLKDAGGNVRGWMGIVGKGSEVTLGNVNAQPMMELMVSANSSELHLYGSGGSGMTLSVNSGDPVLSMAAARESGSAGIKFEKEGPSLRLEDGQGSSAVLGAIPLDTHANGEIQPTSVASVTLLDKSRRVIWRAP